MSEPPLGRRVGQAATRALLVGVVLIVAGLGVNLVVHRGSGVLSPSFLLAEVAFDAALAAFVVGPCALLELEARRRGDGRAIPWGWLVAIVGVACAGAAAAFLQSAYTRVALETGSFERALDAAVEASAWLGRDPSLAVLFVCIGLVFGLVSGARLIGVTPPRQVGVALLGGVLPALVLLPALGVPWQGVALSACLLVLSGALLPPLCVAGDRLSARWGGDAG